MTKELSARPGRIAHHLPAALGLLACIAAFAPAAHAQRIYLGGLQGAKLSHQDGKAFRVGVQRLLDRAPARTGETQAWSGPDGMNGTVTILRVFEHAGMPCRALRSTFVKRSEARRKQYDFSVCRTAAGDWKLSG